MKTRWGTTVPGGKEEGKVLRATHLHVIPAVQQPLGTPLRAGASLLFPQQKARLGRLKETREVIIGALGDW